MQRVVKATTVHSKGKTACLQYKTQQVEICTAFFKEHAYVVLLYEWPCRMREIFNLLQFLI